MRLAGPENGVSGDIFTLHALPAALGAGRSAAAAATSLITPRTCGEC